MRLRWRVTYRLDGAPEVVLTGEERCRFEGDRICHLTDNFDEDGVAATLAWMDEHGTKLGLT